MADPASFNVQAFRPYNGGLGKTVSANEDSGTTSYQIPGLSGGTDDNERKRVLVTNDQSFAAHFRMGPQGIQADTNSLKILPGCAYLLTPPTVNPSGVWFAVCTREGEVAEINVVSGEGT